jgi:hypothetical protein
MPIEGAILSLPIGVEGAREVIGAFPQSMLSMLCDEVGAVRRWLGRAAQS